LMEGLPSPCGMEGTALVTGSTDGIGRATAVGLATMGLHVLVHGRDPSKAAEVVAEIRSKGGSADAVVADLASLAEVRRLAAAVRDRAPALKILVNNAGVSTWSRRESHDGFELQFAVNHLAMFLLTNLLLPSLTAAAPARIVTVASRAHERGSIDFGDLQTARRWVPQLAYSRSKLANILFTRELARRIGGSGVTANSLHPGVIGTKLGIVRPFRWLLPGPRRGARTSLYVATAPDIEGVSGAYFVGRHAATPSAAARDDAAAARLWQVSEELTGLARSP